MNNYRILRDNEIVKKGDMCIYVLQENREENWRPVCGSIGEKAKKNPRIIYRRLVDRQPFLPGLEVK
jgi:hypothetical protein